MLISYDSNDICDAARQESDEHDILRAVNRDKTQERKAQSQLGPGLGPNEQ
jgi:hypothetical protein